MNLWNDDRAVSPVIGAILVVAITVVLAAVTGTFVLDIGRSVGETGPTAVLSIGDAGDDYDPSGTASQRMYTIEHQGGDELELGDVKLTIRNASTKELLLAWNGTGGFDGSNSKGSIDDWNVTFDGADVTSGAADRVMDSGDVIVVSVSDASDIDGDDDERKYEILLADTDTSNTVARAATRLE